MNILIDIDHVAKISKLHLTKEEKGNFKEQFKAILEFFSQIDEVDFRDIEPSFHPSQIKNMWREDKAKTWQWNPLGNTKQKEGSYFKSPKIV